jgi:LmbE family N-acetylglucosaminyl deacetylase
MPVAHPGVPTRHLSIWTGRAFASLFIVGAGSGLAPKMADLRLQSNSDIRTDFVVIAHEDDWQLFMGDALANRLRAGDRVVLVYLTAGDDAHDSTYWRSRERAALQSTRVAAGTSLRSVAGCRVVEVKDHPITRCDVSGIASYFLRLPDGRRNGQGFAAHGYQTLRKFRAHKTGPLTAIDGSTTYASWSELASTVSALAVAESGRVVVHTTDPNIAINPHDHFDHRMAGLLVDDLRRRNHWDVVYYVGYALATRAANRSSDDVRTKTELFLAYDREMLAADPMWSAYREHPAFYSACMQRTYSRRARRW